MQQTINKNKASTDFTAKPNSLAVKPSDKQNIKRKLKQDFKRNKMLYLMILPVIVFFVVFSYLPMAGIITAFKDYRPIKGIWGSPWATDPSTGEKQVFYYFITFFTSPNFIEILKNTLIFSAMELVVVFPAPIILALAMHSIKNKKYRRVAQTLVYLPYFISMIVVCGIIRDFTQSEDGIISVLFQKLGLISENEGILNNTKYFRWIVVLSNVWTGTGYGSVVYIAALSSIDQTMYEAAEIDGAGKWRTFWRITFPSILPTIMIFFLLRIAGILNYNFEKIHLLYSTSVYSVADVISTYVYRRGIVDGAYSLATAVGLFSSTEGFILLIIANYFAKKFGQSNLF